MNVARTFAIGLALGVGLAAQQKVDFVREVQPILMAKCGACHMGEKPQAGLLLHARADILKGGTSGPAVVPGASRESLLIHRVTGFAAPVMPLGGEPLPDREIEILRAWIDQGAEGPAPGRPSQWPRPVRPRRPELPASELEHPIDRFVEAHFRRQGKGFPAPASDELFARRAFLDLWGLPPTPEQRREFLSDARPDKRERLVDRLLADKKNYSEHWISFWNDLLRNDEGVVYHGARQSITAWLLKALEENLPYNEFVSALLNPARKGDPAGFLVGVNWRGDINASQTPVMQAAQNSAQVFLGVNLKCNSCHDSFISNWKLADAYGLASFFADADLDVYRCDVKTGEKASAKFLFSELAPAETGSTPAERRATAARLFTSPENGRFARTLVNRYWKRLLGRGLVEPVDDMDAEPWDGELLDWLAADFVAYRYDLKHLLRRVMSSRAYQLTAARDAAPPRGAYMFRGPAVRRLSAEQFADSIAAITGEWRVLASARAAPGAYAREWRLKSTPLTRALGRPIRDQVFTERSQDAATLQALELANGETLARALSRGARRLLGEFRPSPANLFDSGVARNEEIPVGIDISGARELRLLIEDADSYDRSRVVAGWANAQLISPAEVTPLAELQPRSGQAEVRSIWVKKEELAGTLVGAVPSELVYDIAGKGYTWFCAVVGVDDSSQKSDISPRARFFVFTEEPDRHQLVRVAGGEPASAERKKASGEELIERLYQHVLGRDPGADERRVAREMMDRGVEGLEDLLWSLFLSPEFQYIR